MGEVIITTDIPREKEYMYYCGMDEKGNLTVLRMLRPKTRRKKDETKSK